MTVLCNVAELRLVLSRIKNTQSRENEIETATERAMRVFTQAKATWLLLLTTTLWTLSLALLAQEDEQPQRELLMSGGVRPTHRTRDTTRTAATDSRTMANVFRKKHKYRRYSSRNYEMKKSSPMKMRNKHPMVVYYPRKGKGMSSRGMGMSSRGIGMSSKGMGMSSKGMGMSSNVKGRKRGKGKGMNGKGMNGKGMNGEGKGKGKYAKGKGMYTRGGKGKYTKGKSMNSNGKPPSPNEPPVPTPTTPTVAPSNAPLQDFEDEDSWQEGTPINVEITDNLELLQETRPFNFIWIANSGRGTIAKVDTLTGDILGEYRSGPDSAGPGNPSRTTVASDGSLWVANRNHSPGTVVHIGLEENGQCEDRNGNGVIDTSTGVRDSSTGYHDVRDWLDESGERGVQTALDECILAFIRVSSTGTRHLSLDADNNLWVGGYSDRNWDLVQGGNYNDPGYGGIIQHYDSVGYGGYGGLIDKNNVLWSARPLLRWDVSLPLEGQNGDPPGNDIGPPVEGLNWAGDTSGFNSYGICLDSQGNVWVTEYGSFIMKFSPEGVYIDKYGHGYSAAQGCVVGLDDDVWVAHSLSGNSVGHLRNDGSLVGTVPVGDGPTGVSVDAEGKIWSANINSNDLSRIDPSLNNGVGAVDKTVDLGPGASPYNYGDMTGSVNPGAPKQGSWTFLYDSGVVDQGWGILTWQADTPSDSKVIVEARSSSDGMSFSAYETAQPNVDLNLPDGQYLEIRVLLIRATTGESPVVRRLVILDVGS